MSVAVKSFFAIEPDVEELSGIALGLVVCQRILRLRLCAMKSTRLI